MTDGRVRHGTGIRVRWVVGIGARSGIDEKSVRDALDELWRRVAELEFPPGTNPQAARPARSGSVGLAASPGGYPADTAAADSVHADAPGAALASHPAGSAATGPTQSAADAGAAPASGSTASVPAAQIVYASLRAKAREPGILAAIAPARLVVLDAAELAAVEVPTPSERVGRAVGTPSVAEAAALAVARRLGGARLAVPKIVGDGVTVAAALSGRCGADPR